MTDYRKEYEKETGDKLLDEWDDDKYAKWLESCLSEVETKLKSNEMLLKDFDKINGKLSSDKDYAEMLQEDAEAKLENMTYRAKEYYDMLNKMTKEDLAKYGILNLLSSR